MDFTTAPDEEISEKILAAIKADASLEAGPVVRGIVALAEAGCSDEPVQSIAKQIAAWRNKTTNFRFPITTKQLDYGKVLIRRNIADLIQITRDKAAGKITTIEKKFEPAAVEKPATPKKTRKTSSKEKAPVAPQWEVDAAKEYAIPF